MFFKLLIKYLSLSFRCWVSPLSINLDKTISCLPTFISLTYFICKTFGIPDAFQQVTEYEGRLCDFHLDSGA